MTACPHIVVCRYGNTFCTCCSLFAIRLEAANNGSTRNSLNHELGIVKNLRKIDSSLVLGRQEDAQQFLTSFVDLMKREWGTVGDNPGNAFVSPASVSSCIVGDTHSCCVVFQDVRCSTSTRCQCTEYAAANVTRTEPLTSLSLGFSKRAHSVDALLDKYFKEVSVKDKSCESCGREVRFSSELCTVSPCPRYDDSPYAPRVL